MTLMLLAASPVAAAPPTKAEAASARRHVKAADRHFDRQEWAQAIARYQSALAILPGKAALVWNIARAHEEAGKKDLALAYFRQYLKLPVSETLQERARVRIEALEPTPVAAPEPVVPDPVEPEPVVVEPVAPEPVETTPTIQVAAPPAGMTGLQKGGWATFGVGIAVAGLGGALSGLGQAAYDEVLSAQVIDGVTQLTESSANSAQSRGDDLAVSGIALLSIGGAAALTGLILALLADDAGTAASVMVTPTSTGWMASGYLEF